MDIAERASALELLLKCSAQSAENLALSMIPREYSGKSVLCYQGDLNDSLWLLLKGTVQLQSTSIEGQTTVISTFGPGELVGSFPDESELGFDALTTENAETLQIGANELRRLLTEYPDLGAGFAAIFSGQLDTVLDRLAARVSLSANGRFYRELLRLAGDDGIISPPPVIAALALVAQTTRETGSRAVSALERRGIIERGGERMTIVSRRMLESLVV